MNEGKPEDFLAVSQTVVKNHVAYCVMKAKTLANYVNKLETFLEVIRNPILNSVLTRNK